MLSILYIFIVLFVTGLFTYLLLFPFCKVWKRLKYHHPDIWASKGPFDIRNMAAYPTLVTSFMEVISLADRDETLVKKDPELIKWTRMSREIWKMMPTTFIGQVGYFICFMWFILLFSSLIMDIFR